ncbi:uncharacterized protein LOC131223024 isoform X3 [Magnolia sinica]|uniref:uncharacterized protein LOC131223024 isoform X3 n=1 Tax=Magnolia sinica TaxID=86752 RepID=UPI0026580C36|nr:uncharacterized protein LOC131223024 isoform X3 [Magnolia sinica]
MKLKQLEGYIGNLNQFSNPKIDLEQYPTGAHIASRLLYTAENTFGDISGKVVADFGCGCGTLGIAGALLGAEHVVGIDIDSQSLEIASLNAADLELDINLIWCDIKNLKWRVFNIVCTLSQALGPKFTSSKIVDTVVMNPPFGTRKKGSDMDFLFMALKVASQAVYSLHKTTTRDLRFDVSQLYKYHKKKEVDIAVDLWRFVP